ncbi:MAG: EAL domain-containing protein [Chromatiaceae bacterium]|nr:EAL domain-containing protein [Chromatiaceae bacterium]
MKNARFRSGSIAIGVAGAALGIYLATLIAFGYVGQQRLRSSLFEQEQLSIEKQATAVAYFLANQRETLAELSESRQISTYLANRDLGMSMRYGLRASLMAVARDIKRLMERKRVHGRQVFSSVAFIEPDGQVLLEIDNGEAFEPRQPDASQAPVEPAALQVRRGANGSILTTTATISYKGKTAGFLAADFDASSILGPFLADRAGASQHRRTALVGPSDMVIVASDEDDWAHWRQRAANSDEMPIVVPVAGTNLSIVSFPDMNGIWGFLNSPLFLAALAFFSVPLLGGVIYLLRLNSHNLVLQTRTQVATQQRMLLKQQNARLQREIDKRVKSEEQLAHQANFDQLTGLPNRNLALDRLAQAIKWAKRENGSVLVLFLDLDRFKLVNDSLGHAAGDELLREAAQRLQSRVRESDTVSRLGGDEFLIICPEEQQQANWEQIAQQLIRVLAQPFYIGDHEFFVGASIGVAAYPVGGVEPHKLLKNADIAMYAAKEQGRNRFCYYDPSMDASAVEAMRLENNLRHAMERNELSLVYQPIVDLSSSQTVAVEALLRWHSAELGNVPPDKFIPVAEETGLIHEIGEWVLVEACRTISAMQPGPAFRVAINLSSKQFSRPARLLDCTLYALQSSGLMPSQLELEITESILIDDRPEIFSLINQLDRIGVRLSIDDFGTGYSALNYLQRFPFDVLKIDRTFTSQVPDNEASASLIRAIIAMAHALGLEVIAEGIESREQAGFLLVQHCELGQGYLYSRPITAEQLRAHLAGEEVMSA